LKYKSLSFIIIVSATLFNKNIKEQSPCDASWSVEQLGYERIFD